LAARPPRADSRPVARRAQRGRVLPGVGRRRQGRGRGSIDTRTTWRTHRCGALRTAHVGARVRLGGWVHRRRDLGGIVFLDLRDRDGIVQVAFGPGWTGADVMSRAQTLGSESVVVVEGEVVARPPTMKNAELATGDIEVHATAVTLVGPAETP